ncbi:unnamed protein product [Rotaria sordida]|uniref:Uncharacterized protein n=1 Tax=Rotaria sordida TaxID=392033 RepID=A0A814UE04_9BILA|nr:unnamed protein product [Rotaria sordida]CAF1172844.1 unnamed protein product [Rotaria sordida]
MRYRLKNNHAVNHDYICTPKQQSRNKRNTDKVQEEEEEEEEEAYQEVLKSPETNKSLQADFSLTKKQSFDVDQSRVSNYIYDELVNVISQ